MKLFKTINQYSSGEITKQEYIDEMYQLHQVLFEYAERLSSTDIASVHIQDGGIIFTSRERDIKIWFTRADKRAAPFEILNFNFYESTESNMIFRLVESLSPSCTIFDIGANIGWYSLNIAKQFPSARVWSFEPVPPTFTSFQKNLSLNPDISNITIYNLGFSDREETLKFYWQPEASVSASLANITESETVEEVTCKVRKLDEFTAEKSVKVDFIKCDVEGAELLVYRGGLETIARDKPIIFTEMLRKWSAKFDYHPNQIIQLLTEVGYSCFTIGENRLSRFTEMDDNTPQTNFFFLHEEKHRDPIEKYL